MPNDKTAINKLTLQFEDKLKLDWPQKWGEFGNYNPEKLNRRSKFYTALAMEISKRTGINISRDTIQRFDQNKGGDSTQTLNIVAKYLDYEHFDAFSAFQIKQLADGKQPRNTKNNIKIAKIGASILLISALGYSLLIKPYTEKQKILKVITEANQAQFMSFGQLPIIDTLKIEKYYSKKGNAWPAILTSLITRNADSLTISQPKINPSYYKLFEARVISINAEKAIVETDEYWFLKWYKTDSKTFVSSYDVKNTQLYELEKINDNWIILNNFFEGKAKPITEKKEY